MNKSDKIVLEFLYFCKDILNEEKILRESYLLEADPALIQKNLEITKTKLANVSSRQHQAFLNIKRYEALAIEKLKTHRYANNPQFIENQTAIIKDKANKRIAAIDKAAESTKTQLRNSITNLEKELELSKTLKGKVGNIGSKAKQVFTKVGSKLGTKGKIATGAALAAAAGGGLYLTNKKKKKTNIKEDFDYSTLLQYKK